MEVTGRFFEAPDGSFSLFGPHRDDTEQNADGKVVRLVIDTVSWFKR